MPVSLRGKQCKGQRKNKFNKIQKKKKENIYNFTLKMFLSKPVLLGVLTLHKIRDMTRHRVYWLKSLMSPYFIITGPARISTSWVYFRWEKYRPIQSTPGRFSWTSVAIVEVHNVRRAKRESLPVTRVLHALNCLPMYVNKILHCKIAKRFCYLIESSSENTINFT